MNKIEVIYKDQNFLVINKPAGLLVHQVSGVKHQELTLADWLIKNYPEVKKISDPYYRKSGLARHSSAEAERRWGIVHRLDKDTSGIMVVARNQKTFDYLKSLFQKHLIQKTYIALVVGRVKDKTGRIEKPIGIKSGTARRSVFAKKMKMVKEAITEYRVIKFVKLKDNDFTLLEVMPKTGRTHQIRVHLASIGHPVAGDKLYGGKRTKVEGLGRQFLHAQSVEFTDPNGKRMRFEAELPEELAILLS